MPDNTPSNALQELGFADFVAVLLVETLDSIVASHTSQAERLRALEAAAELTAQEIAATGVGPELLAATLSTLFPDGKGGTSLAAGAPAPAASDLAELEIKLDDKDVEGKNLTKRGVDTIVAGVRLYLGERQLVALREVAERGVPRVLVEGGTLRARVNFQAVTAEPEKPAAPPTPRPALQPTVALRMLQTPVRLGVLDSIRTTRLQVTNLGGVVEPDPGTGNGSQRKAEVFGEIEIRFRTEL